VVGERRGGTSFFGIDVTDPANPQFKWTYPNTKLGFGVAGKTGESWNDYLPLAPPIGPVRYKPSATATTQERWIVALNGGADPTQQRGQGLSLVDVWTGDALKTFGFGAALADSDDPLKEMKFSFAGAVALYGWGSTDSSPNMNFNGYFFDTAVAGDTGGNLWAFRFNDADPSKWTAARFLSPGANVSARQPFYEMPALFATDTGWLRAVIGSGDRFALHEPGVAPCTAGNPMACVRAGCKVALASHEHGYDFGSSSSVVVNPEFTCTPATSGTSGTTSAGCSATFTSASVSDTGSYTACNTPSIHSTTPTGYTESRFVLDCQTVSGNKYEYKIREGCSSSSTSFCTSGNDFTCETSPRKECKWNGSDHSCNLSSTERISPTTATNAGFNALYSVRVFGGTRGIFNKLGSSTTDTDSAKKFDTNRLTLASLKTPTNTTGTVIPINPLSTTVPTSLASSTDDGWWLPYISAANTSGYTYDQAERTSGGASVFNGCAFVNTIKASAATASGSGTCATSQVNSQARYYHVHAVTGGLCPSPTSFSSCTDPANFANCVRNSVTSPVPPPTPQIAVFVSIDTGQISFNVVNSTPGQSPTANRVGANSDPFQWIYSVEVPRAVHQCRHPTDGTNACQ
jgi:type IV pilus assembly protein PilY1